MYSECGLVRRPPFEHLRWRFPEYWMLALSAVAWVSLVTLQRGHVHRLGMLADWSHWMLMVMAMMIPMRIDAVRLIAERSLWSRRQRSITGYLIGYVSVWAVAGVPLAWAKAAFELPNKIDWMVGAAIGFFVAAAWLVSPWKAVAVRMCHRARSLSPLGWRADRDCVGYGWISGCGCAFNCWPLMLGCWLSRHSPVIMFLGFGFGWADRHFTPSHKTHALLLAALASIFAACSQLR
jgi:hypothetical protein